MPMVDELIQPLYWVRDDPGFANTYRQVLHYNAWPGVEWYSLRSGDVVPFPGQRISAETGVSRQADGRWMVRTVRLNTTGPNFRRSARDLTYTQACDLAAGYRQMHERYVLGRLGTRRAEYTPHADEMPEEVTPRCDYCNATEEDSPQLTWDGDEGMHEECIPLLAEAMRTLTGRAQRLNRDSVRLPEQPDRPRLNRTVPEAHDGWFV